MAALAQKAAAASVPATGHDDARYGHSIAGFDVQMSLIGPHGQA